MLHLLALSLYDISQLVLKELKDEREAQQASSLIPKIKVGLNKSVRSTLSNLNTTTKIYYSKDIHSTTSNNRTA